MRPRRYCRGDKGELKSVTDYGMGFNEAAALLPRRCASKYLVVG